MHYPPVKIPIDKELLVDLVERLPQGAMSRAWGWLARRRRPRLGIGALKHAFVMATGIDMNEAAAPIDHYPTLEDLFIRPLRAGARRIDPDPAAVVSPVDGRIGEWGRIERDTLFQVKGRAYRLSRLLADNELAERFAGGSYATIYLAPHNYHRIHAPLAGKVGQAAHIPGALLPVFPEALQRVDELFARNERLITYLDSVDAGRIAVVKVGATLVGRITLAYDPAVHTNINGGKERRLSYDPPVPVAKGGELGAFCLGSTVVLVFEPGRVQLNMIAGSRIRMGERIGTLTARKPVRKTARAKAAPAKPKSDTAAKKTTEKSPAKGAKKATKKVASKGTKKAGKKASKKRPSGSRSKKS